MRILSLRRSLLLLVASLLMTGCVGTGPPSVETSPTRPPLYANLDADWSSLNGTFQLYELKIAAQVRTNGTEWKPLVPSCVALQVYDFLPQNGTLWTDRGLALHPTDPGPLWAILLNEVELGPKCRSFGFFGINEDYFHRDIPVLTQHNPERTLLGGDVTFDRANGTASVHGVPLFNLSAPEPRASTLDWVVPDPGTRGKEYHASVQLEYLGDYPYSWIRRF